MPLYFFDVHDGDSVAVDQTGTDLPDESVARVEATKTLSEIAAEEIPRDGPQRDFALIVRSEQGKLLFELRLTFQSQTY